MPGFFSSIGLAQYFTLVSKLKQSGFFFFFTFVKVSFCSYHMAGPISGGLVTQSRNTLLGVAVTGAAALHDQVINGKMLGGKRFACGGEVFGLTRTRLMAQQANSDVGDF